MRTHDLAGDVDPYQEETSRIANRRRLAELMIQSSMGAPAYSKGAAMAKAASMVLARMDMKDADREGRELSERREATRRGEYGKLAELLTMRPYLGRGEPARDDEGNLMPGSEEAVIEARRAGASSLLGSRDPRVSGAAFEMLAAKPAAPKTYTLSKGQIVKDETGRVLADNPEVQQPEKEPEAVRTLKAQMKAAGIDPDGPMGRQLFEASLRKATTHQPGTTVNVDNAGAKPFWQEFGKGQAEAFQKEQEQARGAAQMLQSIGTAKDLLSKGIYSGTAADWRLSAGKALKQAGFNMNENDIANTEAFVSTMGNQVLAGIKQLGAGSAISNADRDFMEKVVGGKITLDPKGIERILAISETLARSRIAAFNKKAEGLQKQAPAGFLPYSLKVDEPEARSIDDIMRLYGGKP